MNNVTHGGADADLDRTMNCSDTTTTTSSTAAASPPQSQSAAALPSTRPVNETLAKAPQPVPAVGQQAINPLHHLLFAFPVPQLVLPSPLVIEVDNRGEGDNGKPVKEDETGRTTSVVRECAQRHASLPQAQQAFDASLVQQLAGGMQRAVRTLLSDDRVTHLVQEMCHRDGGPRRVAAEGGKRNGFIVAAATAASSDAGGECNDGSATAVGGASCAELSTDAALAVLDRRVTGTLRSALNAAMQRRSAAMQGGADAEHGSPSAWEPNTSCHVQLRRRSRRDEAANESAQHSMSDTTGFIYEASASSHAPKPPRSETHAAMTSPRATLTQNEDDGALLARLLKQPERITSEELESVIAAAPLRPQLLRGADVSKVAYALDVLAGRSVAPSAEDEEEALTAWHRSACGLACCTCLAHPSLSAAAVTGEVVARLVTCFAQTVHQLARRLTASSMAVAQEGREETDAPSDEVRWLEQVRNYLRCWPPIICAEPVSFAGQDDLIRLEDIALRCLFVLPNQLEKTAFMRYASYIHDGALHVYRCVWNHLVVQRDELTARLFGRVPVSELLLLRTGSCGVDDGCDVLTCSDVADEDDTTSAARCMPLTLAVLSAAQSVPLELLSRTADTAAECTVVQLLRRQCAHFAECLFTQLVHADGDTAVANGERTECHVRHAIVVRLFTELAALVGMPQWPVAAWLLCDGLHVVVAAGFANTSVATAFDAFGPPGECDWRFPVDGNRTESGRESLRLLALDCIGSVALRLFDPATTLPPCVCAALPVGHPFSTQHGEADGDSSGASQRAIKQYVLQAVPIDPLLLRTWQRSWCAENNDDGAAEAESDALCGLSSQNVLQAAVYFALSRHAETSRAADVGSTWRHARLAHLLCWSCGDATRAATQLTTAANAVTALALSRASPAAGLALPAVTLRTCCTLLHTTPCLLLSEMTWRALVGALLDVFCLRDRHGAVAVVSESVTRRALNHLTRLTLLHPPLQRVIWPLAQRLLRDGGARVREGAVSLLLVALDGSGANAAGAAAETQTVSELVTDIVTTLLHLLSDRSAAVVSRVVATLETLLTDERYAVLLRGAQGLSLSTYIQYKLFALLGPAACGADVALVEQQQQQRLRHKTEVTRLFARRWTRMSQQYAMMATREDDAACSSSNDTGDGSGPGDTAALLARELTALLTLCSPDFPYEIGENHALVLLMGDVLCSSRDGVAGRKARAGAASHAHLQHLMRGTVRALWSRYQCCVSPGDAVACLAVLHAMARVEGRWLEPLLGVLLHCLDCPPDPASPLHASRELMGGVVLQTCYILRSVLAGAGASATAASSYRVPAVSLEQLARAFTALISRYVGLYQQRVIVAACGALTSMITCGAKSRLSTRVNVNYLQLCYSLMNTYYVRVRALLPELATQPQNVAYTQRFLFLLSEFLRLYPGWRRVPATLLLLSPSPLSSSGQDTEEGGGGVLARDPGLCENCFQLVVDVLAACDDGDTGRRSRLFIIALRVLASLCMQDPTVYLHRSEDYLHEALTTGAELAWQIQGLTLIRDFLREEDARVDLAARVTTRVCPDTPSGLRSLRGKSATAAVDTPTDSRKPTCGVARSAAPHKGEQSSDCTGNSYFLIDKAATADVDTVAEQNSGMSTWLMQHFLERVRELCGSAQPPLRLLCLEILKLTTQGGLLPPAMYLDALIALSADVDRAVRHRAATCLTMHVDLHEATIATAATRGVLLTYELHHACRVDLVRSGLTVSLWSGESGSMYDASTMLGSVHDVWFSALHKRARQQTLSSVLRYFTDESRAAAWYRNYGTLTPLCDASTPPPPPPPLSDGKDAMAAPSATTSACVSPDFAVGALLTSQTTALCTRTPATFLAHLAVVLACWRYRNESDVEHVLQQCRRGVDLYGQIVYEYVMGLCDTASAPTSECFAPPERSPSRVAGPRRQRQGRRRAAAADVTARQATAEVAPGARWLVLNPILLWRAFAVLMLHHVSRTLRTNTSLHTGTAGAHHKHSRGVRRAAVLPGTADKKAVLLALSAIVNHTAVLARCLTGTHDGVAVAVADACALRVPYGAVLDELRYLSEQLRLVLEAEEVAMCSSPVTTEDKEGGEENDDDATLLRAKALHGGKPTQRAARHATKRPRAKPKVVTRRRAPRRRARQSSSSDDDEDGGDSSGNTTSSEQSTTSVSREQSSETSSDAAAASDDGGSATQSVSEVTSDA